MRFSGPFGPSLVAAYTSRRFAYLEEDEQRDLNNYIYHISSKSGSGEYALATILAPGAYARWPLMDRLQGLKMPTVFLCKCLVCLFFTLNRLIAPWRTKAIE